ncbi:transcriptional regulator [Streptomyces sp. NPDC001820]|uniref:transcriptional regulator n=1 Tax=Streptomyces sp. NPDC001820 TaxID=3364613 RepID=UPI0036C7CE5C
MTTRDANAPETGPADALAELRRRLDGARATQRLNKTELARRAALGRTVVSQALSPNASPPTKDTVSALARALHLDPSPLLDLLATATGNGDRDGQGCVVGRPIADWDPLELEVHPAAHAPSNTAGDAPCVSGALPGYVRRPHDQALARLVADAAAGRSRMAVLVGSSSTGKTRACWEAVQPLARTGWRLWHPFDPTRAEAVLTDLKDVGPRTVVWLNEAQHYLGASGGLGERVAAALATLLADRVRGPVLVLGTLWPAYADAYTAMARPGQEDAHPQVRALLADRRISVPDRFDPAAIGAAQALADAGDRQLAAALERAADGCLTQDLAGGPELVHRYRTAPPPARAILQVAMDARRLGTGLHLPLPFLEAAAEDYLTDNEYDALDDNWLEQALADLGRIVHGNLAPLRRIRPRRTPGAPASPSDQPGPAYRLADYLEQHGRTERRMQCPPDSFWHAAWEHVDDHEDLGRLAEAALHRYRLQWAFLLHQRSGCYRNLGTACVSEFVVAQLTGAAAEAVARWAADAGETWAMLQLARESWRGNNLETAEAYARRAADAGDPDGLYYLGHIREDAGDRRGANELICQAADHGHEQALLLLADAFRAEGNTASEMNAVRGAAEQGSLLGLGRFLKLLREEGDEEQVQQLGWHVAVACGLHGMLLYAGMRRETGRTSTPEDLVDRTAGHPDPVTLAQIAEQMRQRGDKTAAERLALRAAAAGEAEAWGTLVDLRIAAGDPAGAEKFARKAATAGDTISLLLVAEAHEEAGNHAEAEAFAQEAGAAGDAYALLSLADFRINAGDPAGAEALALQAGSHGNTEALLFAAKLREEAGDINEAEKYARQAADGGAFSDPSFSGHGTWLPDQVAAQWPYGLDADGTPSTAWHLQS